MISRPESPQTSPEELQHTERSRILGVLKLAEEDQPKKIPYQMPDLQPRIPEPAPKTEKPPFFPVKPPNTTKEPPKGDDRYRWN